MMAAALPVDDESVDVEAILQRMKQGIPPADVQEYLWRVRLEAEGIPDVVVATNVDPRQYDVKQTANMPAIDAFEAVVDPAMEPADEWRQNLLAEFAELRQLIARWQEIGPPNVESDATDPSQAVPLRTNVPRMNDQDGWHTFFFGRTPNDSEPTDSAPLDHGTPPHLRLLLQFDQVLTRRLLAYHTNWLEDMSALSRARAVWIYALLARLDKPAHADVAAMLRQLPTTVLALAQRASVCHGRARQASQYPHRHHGRVLRAARGDDWGSDMRLLHILSLSTRI
ncbi:hypothetical protein PINS_up002892 [Pythium insidiosum]|nr:hypothetical protein PINS_up002892 [Pythium insidiosum]